MPSTWQSKMELHMKWFLITAWTNKKLHFKTCLIQCLHFIRMWQRHSPYCLLNNQNGYFSRLNQMKVLLYKFNNLLWLLIKISSTLHYNIFLHKLSKLRLKTMGSWQGKNRNVTKSYYKYYKIYTPTLSKCRSL